MIRTVKMELRSTNIIRLIVLRHKTPHNVRTTWTHSPLSTTALRYSICGHQQHDKLCARKLLQQRKTHCLYSNIMTSKGITLKSTLVQSYIEAMILRYESAQQALMQSDANSDRTGASQTIHSSRNIVDLYQKYQTQAAEKVELNTLITETTDVELVQMATTELETLDEELNLKESTILDHLVPPIRTDNYDVTLEVQAGVGGQEAMLFVEELFTMYQNFAIYRGWAFNIIQQDQAEGGGLRYVIATVSGKDVYRWMKLEGGVHRVQRVPRTEKASRVHTSTASVSVIPQPTEIDIRIEKKDLRVDTFRASGAGGQHVNTTESAVRITHIPTGVSTECQQMRSQIKNREVALQVLRSKLYEKEMEQQHSKLQSQRKIQIGTAARSEKIRTYNFNQDRITDHRITSNRFNMESFLSGSNALQGLQEDLLESIKAESLLEMLQQFRKDQEKGQKAVR